MIRKQLYVEERHARELRALARRTGQPEATDVRAALDLYLARQSHDPTATTDPFERLIGIVDDPDGPDDVAVNHDHYLYGAPKVE